MKTSNETTITKKELNSVFWRSFTINASFNYERQMNQGYVYSMIPVLKKLYPEREVLADALKRHSEFFNVTPMVAPFVMGMSTAMEEQGARDEDFDKSSISAVKSALMGPLSGIGDSVFWGTLRPLAAGIACSLAMLLLSFCFYLTYQMYCAAIMA